MTRNLRRLRADWAAGVHATVPATITVLTEEFSEEGRATGILDASGRPIYRAEIRRPIGFVHFDKPAGTARRS